VNLRTGLTTFIIFIYAHWMTNRHSDISLDTETQICLILMVIQIRCRQRSSNWLVRCDDWGIEDPFIW